VERIEITATHSAPAQDARHDRNPDSNPDQPGAHFAGDENAGRHTGRGAEAPNGHQGRGEGDAGTEPAHQQSWPMAQGTQISLALDNGGVYRLHLDAVA
jgi:hypothetical protein